jgi:LPS-assembly lipoprotein
VLALLAAAPLAACGFTPAYGPAGSARQLQGRVAIDPPATAEAFAFTGRLEERLGRAEGAAWRLSYEITTSIRGLGLTPDNVTTRFQIDGRVSWRLAETGSGAIVAQGLASSFTGFGATSTVVATAAAEEDARVRLMRILADQVLARLVAESQRWGPG